MRNRKCLSLVLILGFCILLGSSYADDRRLDKTRLKIMTFNADFLFDGIEPEGQADFPWKGSPAEARSHMAAIADVIKSTNADIINLVEVENLSTLETLNHDFLSGFNYHPYLTNGTDNYTRQNVGLLTRIDPVDNQVHRTEEKGLSGSVMKGVSKHYYTTIHVNERDIVFIGVHLLAHPNDQSSKAKREAQADAIRKLAVEQSDSLTETVIWGDCNDFDPDCPDIAGDMPITTVLTQLKEMRPADVSDNLVSVICEKQYPKNLRYTAWWDKNQNGIADQGEFSSIDHILISQRLARYLQSVDIIHSYTPAEVSDHFPIVATFDFSTSESTGTLSCSALYIAKVLPNPEGNESELEALWLANPGRSDITLSGWKLRDKAGKSWDLERDGKVKAGETKKIPRGKRPMSLNNKGDVLELVDPNGLVVSVVAFGGSDPDEVFEFTR